MIEFAKRRAAAFKMTFRLAIAFSLMAIAGAGMVAAQPNDVTEEEMRLIPRYCPDTMGFKYGDAYYNTSPNAKKWVGMMGSGFWAMHHYCWAQIHMNRSRKAGIPANERKQMWESARGDYLYVIKNSPPDFILLPEIYTRVGEVELLRGQPNKANEAFAHARQLKPDYWPAYSHWAEFLMNTGHRPEALKVVTSGLQQSPGARVLLEQFRILGGKPSDIPRPVEKPRIVDAPTSEVKAAIENNPLPPDTKRDEK